MESTGQRGKIQVSQETADLLVAAGRMAWITPREERVVAKGKGEMQTYWCNIGTTIDISGFQDGLGSLDGSLSDEDGPFALLSPKTTRLVLWNVEILLDLLRQIQVLRGPNAPPLRETVVRSKESSTTAYDEVEDVINFPPYRGQVGDIDTEDVELMPEVEQQLEDFLSTIATMYIENHFHDFAHASHATMGVVKLLSSLVKGKPEDGSNVRNASYLIASNPLVQFAVVLSIICKWRNRAATTLTISETVTGTHNFLQATMWITPAYLIRSFGTRSLAWRRFMVSRVWPSRIP